MVCKRFHALRFCQQFLKMNTRNRNRIVRRYGYCENCLARSHDLRSCPSLDLCRKCDSYHHTLLHPSHARNDLRGRLNRQHNPQRQRSNNHQRQRSSNTRNSNNSNRTPSNNNQHAISNNNNQNPVTPDQQIISEAIRSLAQVLCAQQPKKPT